MIRARNESLQGHLAATGTRDPEERTSEVGKAHGSNTGHRGHWCHAEFEKQGDRSQVTENTVGHGSNFGLYHEIIVGEFTQGTT